jgi:hypothetical protein
MTIVPPQVNQSAQWQTRVQLRSNDGMRYEINRQILINRRLVIPIMRYLTDFQWFLCQSLPGTKAPVQGW